MRISAVLACHDEERFIGAWLEETASYADEVLIAVHAPTDATPEIIGRFKANSPVSIECEWFPADTVARYGFSLMKNEMIARATGDWVISIDADEELDLTREQLHDLLDAAVGHGHSAVSLVWAEHPHPERRGEGWTMESRHRLRLAHIPENPPVRKRKIFRNNYGIWWYGLIHEELACEGQGLSHCCLDSNAILHHYAYLNPAPAEWKAPLYAFLLCRVRDCPHLRTGTNSWWYEDSFDQNEIEIRSAAARFELFRDSWFPEISRREL